MANYVSITSRTLSGKGTIRVSDEQRAKTRQFVLNSKVVRKPPTTYGNLQYTPPRGFYGTLVLLKRDSVFQTLKIEYDSQTWFFASDAVGQAMYQIACINQEILQSISNLGVSLGRPPISFQNETSEWKPLDNYFDTIQFTAYATSAIKFDLYQLPYDVCEEIQDDPPFPPPPPFPDETTPLVSPTSPLQISTPYAQDTQTSHNPADIDDTPPSGGCPLQSGYMCVRGLNTATGQNPPANPITFQYRRAILGVGFGVNLLQTDSSFAVGAPVPRCVRTYASDCVTIVTNTISTFPRENNIVVSVTGFGSGSPQC